MSDVFYLRPVDPPTTAEAALEASKRAGGCFDLHRVDWLHSFLSTDGGRMLCWYRAPDAESARLALRELGSDMNAVWAGRVVGPLKPRNAAVSRVDVLAEVPLGESRSVAGDELLRRLEGARGDDGAATFAAGFVANGRDRMVCLFQGGDAEGVRSVLERAGFPDTSAWSCTVITP